MIKVYIADVSENCLNAAIYPDERAEEIRKVTNAELKKQKISCWKLLEAALCDCTEYGVKQLNFKKSESGKWICDKLCFSLAHTDGQVAVALSDKSVGVDIESFDAFKNRNAKRLSSKILCNGEKADSEGELIAFWTQKESIYKREGSGAFIPDKIRVADYTVRTFENGGYCVSVCSDDQELDTITINKIKL